MLSQTQDKMPTLDENAVDVTSNDNGHPAKVSFKQRRSFCKFFISFFSLRTYIILVMIDECLCSSCSCITV